MKLNKIISLIKKSTSITLFKDEVSGRILISNGAAAYDVSCFPNIETEDELAAVLGIDKVDDHVFSIRDIPEIMYDPQITNALTLCKIEIRYSGKDYVFFEDDESIYAVDKAYLKPFDEEDLFYVSVSEKGTLILVGGLVMQGFICPLNINDELKFELAKVVKKVML